MNSRLHETKSGLQVGGGELAGVKLQTKAAADGSFEGYASVFGVEDRGGDTVVAGAFTKCLEVTPLNEIKLLWQHDAHQVIGHFTEVVEDGMGLKVRGQLLLDVQKGREAHALMKVDAIDSLSIGYKTIRSDRNEDDWTRKLLEIDLWEISLVTFPQLPSAKVSAKSAPQTERELEAFLRDAGGYSKKRAQEIVAGGFKAGSDLRDAGDDGANISSWLAELREVRTKLKS